MQTNMVQCRSRRRSAWARLSVGLVLFIADARRVHRRCLRSTGRPWSGVMDGRAGQSSPIGAQVPTFRLYVTPLDVTVGNNTWALADIDYYLDKYIPADVLPAVYRRHSGRQLPPDRARDRRGAAGHRLAIGLRRCPGAGRRRRGRRHAGAGPSRQRAGRAVCAYWPSFDMAVFGDAAVGLSVPIGSALRVGARYHQLYGLAYGYAEADGQFVIRSDEPGVDGEGLVGEVWLHARGE